MDAKANMVSILKQIRQENTERMQEEKAGILTGHMIFVLNAGPNVKVKSLSGEKTIKLSLTIYCWEVQMKSRMEVAQFINSGELEEQGGRERPHTWHIGMQDLRLLLDFIYDGAPNKPEEKIVRLEVVKDESK